MSELIRVFQGAMSHKVSDIHLTPGEPFIFRRFGELIKVRGAALTAEQCQAALLEILNQKQREKLYKDLQIEFVLEIPQLGRFRASAVCHHNGLGVSFRIIPPTIPTLAQLGLPDIVKKVLDNHQGLILVTGSTGQGKSTSMAAIIDHINTNRAHHIITVEDPIEFVHPLKKSVVSQRELGTNTLSYENALRGALRQDPDVIMVGELRDLETMSLAMTAAETGHLVIGTLATSSAPKTIDRIIDLFPTNEQSQIRAMLSESLKAVITQRLLPHIEGNGFVLAVEILIGTLPLANLIRDDKVFQIRSMMQTSKNLGMQIMDDSLYDLVTQGKLAASVAIQYAESPKRFAPLIQQDT